MFSRTNEKNMSSQDEEINDTWHPENRLSNFTAGLGFIVNVASATSRYACLRFYKTQLSSRREEFNLCVKCLHKRRIFMIT